MKSKPARAAFFIDGFNLYHAINELQQPHLKWINYWTLCAKLIPQRTELLSAVTWCTAFYPGDPEKKWRHEQLIGAQKCFGVQVVRGHFVHEEKNCKSCGHTWKQPTEKEGDINVALHMIKGAYEDSFDHAYLLSADSDQAATLRLYRSVFPHKRISCVVPPARKRSEHLHRLINGTTIQLNVLHLESAVMPEKVFEPRVANVTRPREYAPPHGWVHPDARPKK